MSCILGIEQSCDECRMFIPGVKKQTNADRIRNMTDEELADFIGGFFAKLDTCYPCPANNKNVFCGNCKKGILVWLQSEVEE